jgi:predicted enzyme related to lactoylglutathione lyase
MKTGDWFWHELMTDDVEKAKAFYGGLLGWQSKDWEGSMPYTVWRHGDSDHGGMMAMQGPQFEGAKPQWMIYVAVEDVDAAAAKVPELGGTVQVPPMDIPEVGRFAIVVDPSGAALGLITPQMPG